MDARTRLLRALRNEPVDAVPWSCYRGIIPTGEVERELRNRGMALVVPVTPYSRETPDVEVVSREVWERGEHVTYRTYRTPVGEVTEKRRSESGYGSSWRVEYVIRSPEDYPVVEYIYRHTRIVPDYDAVTEVEKDLGGDGVALAWTTRSPYQEMYIELMGLERMALDRADGLPGFFALREAMEELHDEIYRVVAASPATVIWCPDNLTDLVAGGDTFRSYYVPYYNAKAKFLAEAGKIMVTHMDGRLASLKGDIAGTSLPVIEAFTPPPMGDLGVAEAKAAWPEKVIWSNFPGSVFLEEPEEVKRFTVELLEEAMDGGRFILGITENIPLGVRNQALLAMADGIEEYEKTRR